MPFSVKNILNDSQITLEKAATDKFGAVVDDFARGALSSIGISSASQDSSQSANRNDGSWYSSSYAAALAGGSYRPKLKFLFKVEFIFTEEAKKQASSLGLASANDFTFMIKSVERPKVDFEYEEDVNMYNYRTKVLKKIRHRDLTIVFMDDVGNRVFNFFRTLMMIHSPITRRQVERDNTLRKPTPSSSDLIHTSGMDFTQKTPYAAHRSVVNSSFGNSIEAIRVKQIFVDGSAGLATASKMVVFDFMNPRIVSFDMDELTHDSSDPNLLTMVFDYDWMEMVNVGALGTNDTRYQADYTHMAPGVHGAPTDISPNKSSGAQGPAQGNNGILGQLGSSISSIGGRAVQQLSSDLISKAVKTIAGTGRFQTAIGGVASSSISSILGGVATSAGNGLFNSSTATGPVTGIIGGAQRDLSVTSARATSASIVDSTTPSARPVSATFSSNAYAGTNSASSDA